MLCWWAYPTVHSAHTYSVQRFMHLFFIISLGENLVSCDFLGKFIVVLRYAALETLMMFSKQMLLLVEFSFPPFIKQNS